MATVHTSAPIQEKDIGTGKIAGSNNDARIYKPESKYQSNHSFQKTERNPQSLGPINQSQENSKHNKQEPGILDLLIKHPAFKAMPKLGLAASIIGNGISSLVNFLPGLKSYRKIATQLGVFGTKAFLFTNGNANFLEQLNRKNYFLAFAYFLENVVMTTVKQAQVFLARGLVSGSYTLGNAINLINRKDKFESMEENAVHVISGLKKAFKKLIENPWKNLWSAETGVLSVVAGMLKILGTSIWLTTGNELLGSTIRNSANMLQNIEQLKFKHTKHRPNFFVSGLGTTLGTIFDYLSKWKDSSKAVLVPMSLLSDLSGIFFLRRSQNRGEMSKPNKSRQEKQ